MTTTTQHQERVLCDKEEELVRLLSGKDPTKIADNLHKKCVLSDIMWDLFTSLDHKRIEPQLQIRYLLRLICKKVKDDSCVWVNFLNLLSDMGGNFNTMRKNLEQSLDKLTFNEEICSPISTASGEPDNILTKSDAEDLTDLLAEISYKWEELGMALKLPKHVRENSRREKNIFSLSNTITSWLSGEANGPTNTTLHTLKKALCGPIVAEPSIAEKVEKQFLLTRYMSSKDNKKSHSNATITNQSGDTVVADGKSTLLFFKTSHRDSTSYQWKKDGHVLINSSTCTGVYEEILVIRRARQGTEGEYTCCVSSEGRQASSNKIILTVEYSAAKKRLLDLYSVTSEVPSDSWPPSGTRTFINLVLIKSSKEPTDITDYTVERSADKVIEQREKVEYEQVFRECKSGELILLEGRPGSGKTTLVHKIIKDWTKGSVLESSRWVMLIPLRELNNIRAESLSDAIGYFCQNDEAITKNIERDPGEGLCFIIDGLDEYQPLDKTKSPIYQLLYKTLLPKAMIIVSSCPSAIKTLDWNKLTKRIEILGFNKEEIFQYIDNFPFSCESDITTSAMYATQLKEYLHSNPNVFNMCYLPVHAAMICFLFKCKGGNFPITQTKIYEQFTSYIMLRHLKHSNSEQQLESLQDLSGSNKKHFKELCLLAYEMTVNSKQVVIPQEINIQLSDSSIAEDTRYLGLVTISHTAKLSGFHSTYTFLHLTFQEFLAALHIANLKMDDQLGIIKENRHSRMTTVWTFYCGLVKFVKGDERISELSQTIVESFNSCSEYSSIGTLDLMKMAFESQQTVVCDNVVTYNKGILIPSELSSFRYVMSSTSKPITKLTLSFKANELVTELCKVLQMTTNKLSSLEQLHIFYYSDHIQVTPLSEVLCASPNLIDLYLYFKDVDGDDMKYLAGALKSLPKLQTLNLHAENISSGITQLFSGLQHLPSTKLELHFEHHCGDCVIELGKALTQLTINRLYRLELAYGSVGVESASALGKGLFNLTKLKYLILRMNNIGDEEVNYLSAGIKFLSNLNSLDLSHNNIGPCGATSLAGGIQHLNLKVLNLSSNNIGCEGATSLAGAIQHLNLKVLILSSNNIGCEGATSLAGAIQQRKTNIINPSNNNSGYEVATSVAGTILYRSYNHLNLSNNNIGSGGARVLAKALQNFQPTGLHLSGNNIDFHGALDVICTLKNFLCNPVCINVKKQDDKCGGFQVQGLVSPGDDASVAALVVAVQHNTRDRILELGFKKITVPSKQHQSKHS